MQFLDPILHLVWSSLLMVLNLRSDVMSSPSLLLPWYELHHWLVHLTSATCYRVRLHEKNQWCLPHRCGPLCPIHLLLHLRQLNLYCRLSFRLLQLSHCHQWRNCRQQKCNCDGKRGCALLATINYRGSTNVRIANTWFCRWMNRMAMFPPLLSPNLFHRIFRRMILQLCIICHYKLIMALLANVLSTFLGRLQAPPCAFFSMVAVLTT